jgi:rare lipoprotein A
MIPRRTGLYRLLLLMLLVSASSCTTQSELPPALPPAANLAPPPVVSAPPIVHPKSREVRASYQGTASAGRPTASGEPYDPDDLTAASRTLPIGSTVIVTNPATGRSVKVRINDRGPYVRGRGLDLSKRAAEEIGLTKKGAARLKITRVPSTPAAEAAVTPPAASSTSATNSSDR